MMRLSIISLFICLFCSPVWAKDKITNDSQRLANNKPNFYQYEAQIIRVIDGDNLEVKIYLLPGVEYIINVRSRGVDAPELHNSKCDWEKTLAKEAKEAIEKRFRVGSWVYIENIGKGKYAGRIVADIKKWYGNQRWRTVTQFLLEKNGRWGVPYEGGKKFDWCRTLPNE